MLIFTYRNEFSIDFGRKRKKSLNKLKLIPPTVLFFFNFFLLVEICCCYPYIQITDGTRCASFIILKEEEKKLSLQITSSRGGKLFDWQISSTNSGGNFFSILLPLKCSEMILIKNSSLRVRNVLILRFYPHQ